MPTRNATAEWEGGLQDGRGTIAFGDFRKPYGFASRFESGPGTNPEELLGAAHAGCFSMALSAGLAKAGFKPAQVRTEARVKLDKVGDGFAITGIELRAEARVPGIDPAKFREVAEATKSGCPVSKALSATPITLQATLLPD